MNERIAKIIKLVEEISTDNVKKPKLIYFDIIGIGWPIRCLLHLQNTDYQYVPITIQEWMYHSDEDVQLIKAAFRSGHVPLYVDNEAYLNQSTQIITTLAGRAGLMGDSLSEERAIQSALTLCYDALFHFDGMLSVNIRLNLPDEVAKARLDAFMGKGVWGLSSNGYRNNLNGFIKYLQANPSQSGYMAGNKLSAADLAAFNVLCNWYKAFDREVFSSEFSVLDEYIQRIAEQPGIADYIRNVQEPTIWFELPKVALRLTSPSDLEGLVALPQ